MGSELHVFAYGSLVFDPELPESIRSSFWARLDGYTRRFNKRSPVRGARTGENHAGDPNASAAFVQQDRADSLAMGLEPSPDAHVVGRVFTYPKNTASTLIARLDDREGYHRGQPTRASGYVPIVRQVFRLGDSAAFEALLYCANPESPLILPPAVPDSERAGILVAATPKVAGEKSCGVDYLAELRRTLAAEGIFDPALERQAHAVAALGASWAARVGLPHLPTEP